MQAACSIGCGAGFCLDLAGEHGIVVAVAEDVFEHRLEVLHLGAALGEISTGNRFGMDDVEIECHRGFLRLIRVFTAADGGDGAADQAAEDLVEQAHAVTLVAAEGEQGGHLVRVGGGLSVLIDRCAGRELFALAFQRLHAAHRHGGGGPVHDDGEAVRLLGWDAPGVGVGAEGREFPAERNHLCECGGAVRVGKVAALGGLHHVAAAPEIVEGVVHGDLGNAVLIRKLDGAVDGLIRNGLAELLVRVPDFGCGETRWENLNFRAGDATAGGRSEKMVQVQGLERMVGADAVAGRLCGEFRAECRLLIGVSAGFVGGDDKLVVGFAGDGQEIGHGVGWVR